MPNDLYILFILCAIGIASRGAYNNMTKSGVLFGTLTHGMMAVVSTLFSIGILVYTFVNFKWWYPIVMLLASGAFAGIFSIIISKLIGTVYSRLILLYILPIIAILYTLIKFIL